MAFSYEGIANELRDRILALIPDHPEILEMQNCFKLFQIGGFKCGDLNPSLGQAYAALMSAQAVSREKKEAQGDSGNPA